MSRDIERHNKFFYDTQQKRMLAIGYLLLTKDGAAWMVFVAVGLYSGFNSFFAIAFYAGVFMYLYNKRFSATIQDRENLFVPSMFRKYLGIKESQK